MYGACHCRQRGNDHASGEVGTSGEHGGFPLSDQRWRNRREENILFTEGFERLLLFADKLI